MFRLLLPLSAFLAACVPVPQKDTMPSSNPASEPLADSPVAAEGRRILSAAFVRVGPDGLLTVELRDGRVLVLQNVILGPNDYCGALVGSASAYTKFCGGYPEVAGARPGGGASLEQLDGANGKPIGTTPAGTKGA